MASCLMAPLRPASLATALLIFALVPAVFAGEPCTFRVESGENLQVNDATVPAGAVWCIAGLVSFQDSFTNHGTVVLENTGTLSWRHADIHDPKGILTNTGTIRK